MARRSPGRPPTPAALVADAVRRVTEDGLSPDAAAEELASEGKKISSNTIRRALAAAGAGTGAGVPALVIGPGTGGGTAGDGRNGPPIPADKLAGLCSLIARLPARQQVTILGVVFHLAARPLQEALAPFPAAARAAARALRAVEV